MTDDGLDPLIHVPTRLKIVATLLRSRQELAGMPSVFGHGWSRWVSCALPVDPAAGPGEWTGLSDEGVAHRAERRCSEGEEGFVEAPEREFRPPGGQGLVPKRHD